MAGEIPDFSEYPLPEVSQHLSKSIFADVDELGLQGFFNGALAHLEGNNLGLHNSVCSFIETITEEGSDERKAALTAMLLTHELLRRQGQTDGMQALFQAPPSESD